MEHPLEQCFREQPTELPFEILREQKGMDRTEYVLYMIDIILTILQERGVF